MKMPKLTLVDLLTCTCTVIPLEWCPLQITRYIQVAIRSCIYTLRINALFPSDICVLHPNFFAVVSDTNAWQELCYEIQAVDQFRDESTCNSVLVMVTELESTDTVSLAVFTVHVSTKISSSLHFYEILTMLFHV